MPPLQDGVMAEPGAAPPDPDAGWADSIDRNLLVQPAVALTLLSLLLERQRWVHRRVEQIEYPDSRSARRFTSNDFTLPIRFPPLKWGGKDVDLVPLALLRKGLLMKLDVRDEEGNAVPVLNTRQSVLAAGAILTTLGAAALGKDLPDVAKDACFKIAELPEDARGSQFKLIKSQVPAILEDALFNKLLVDFSRSFLLLCPIRHEVGVRRIVKFSYHQSLLERTPAGLGQLLGIAPTNFLLPITAAGEAESYHLEVAAPEGLELIDVTTASPRVRPAPPYDFTATVHSDRAALRLASVAPGLALNAIFRLRPSRRGWLQVSSLIALFIAAVLTVGVWRLSALEAVTPSGMGGVPRADVASAFLITLIAGLSVFLVKPPEHVLASDVLLGPRRLVLVDVLIPFIAAGTLVVGPAGFALRLLWGVLAGIAWVIAALLQIGVRRRYPRRATDGAGEELRIEQERLRRLSRARRVRAAKAPVALSILVILLIFGISNFHPVSAGFLFSTRHPKLTWVVITCAAVGGIVSYLFRKPGGPRSEQG